MIKGESLSIRFTLYKAEQPKFHDIRGLLTRQSMLFNINGGKGIFYDLLIGLGASARAAHEIKGCLYAIKDWDLRE